MNFFFKISVSILLLHNFKNVEAERTTIGNATIQGDFAKLRNLGDSTYLTATQSTILSDAGIIAEEVLSEPEVEGASNQTWDGIHWLNVHGRQYWLYTKGSPLKEVTDQQTDGYEIPQKDLFEVIFVPRTSVTGTHGVSLRSVSLDKCITSHGVHTPVTFEFCDLKNLAQRWTAEMEQNI